MSGSQKRQNWVVECARTRIGMQTSNSGPQSNSQYISCFSGEREFSLRKKHTCTQLEEAESVLDTGDHLQYM